MANKKLTPPALVNWLLKHITGQNKDFSLNGDFDEEFYEIANRDGKTSAWLWYWKQFFSSLPFFIKDSACGNISMFNSYVKITFRNILKYKSYSLINIAGLTTGMACCILILLWVQDELSWDRFHKNPDRLFRVVEEVNNPNGIEYRIRTPIILGPTLEFEIPEIVYSTRSVLFSMILEYEDKHFTDDAIDFVDPA